MVLQLPPMPSGRTESVVYFGTPEVAAFILREIIGAGVKVDLVVTRPDAKRGRGGIISPSPVKQVSLDHSIPVAENPDAVLDLSPSTGRLGIVVAYGQIIRDHILAVLPMVNVHFSALPRWRGAAPVERAILAGDPEIGVDIMRVVQDLDAGDVFQSGRLPITASDCADSLRHQLAVASIPMLLKGLSDGFPQPHPQVGEPSYAHKIKKSELVINWSRPAEQILRQVQLGGASTVFRGSVVKIHTARNSDVSQIVTRPGAIAKVGSDCLMIATSSGLLEVLQVQPAGKQKMSAKSWYLGLRAAPDECFGEVVSGE